MRPFEPSEYYRRIFYSEASHAVMAKGRILAPSDDARSLVEKLVQRLLLCENALGESRSESEKLVASFQRHIEDGVCILGSPLLTNVSAQHPTLASCTAVPFGSSEISSDQLNTAEKYYKLNMGSGYNLDSFSDPVNALIALNRHASALEGAMVCERYIGNIAHVSINHPAIQSFIAAKTVHRDLRHFNISVDMNDEFMGAVAHDSTHTLRNDRTIQARDLWDMLINNAWECGDPGLISLERFNADNPVAALSPYKTTAPCAEVGLAEGEACVFAYINLAACLRWKEGILGLDLALIGDVAECLTQVLDDCLENSLNNFPTAASNYVMSSNRKIGIGVCGFADALLWIGLDYGSDESCAFIRSALSTINFRSKHASAVLASRRGAFPRFAVSRYATEPGYTRRAAQYSTDIDESSWRQLEDMVAKHGIRNSTTTALPPSGRTSLLLGVSASIEPLLRPYGVSAPSMPERMLIETGYALPGPAGELQVAKPLASAAWPRQAATSTSPFRGARELGVTEHLSVLAAACRLVDDGISKTVNLPATARASDVEDVFVGAWQAGLKAISVYRDCGPGIAQVTGPLAVAV